MTDSIGIVGGGTVGRATARCYLEWADVRVYDKDRSRSTHCLNTVLQSDVIFVCLPTPESPCGAGLDTTVIEEFFEGVVEVWSGAASANYVLRSTVPVGATRRLRAEYRLPNLVHSPEFLTARCAATDIQLPARNIIGGPVCLCRNRLADLYTRRFPGVQTLVMSSDESEAVKILLNSFFAVKVAFFNEARALADRLCLDWERVLGGVLSDGRVAHSHTRVPGPDGLRGFGGACLPKDLVGFIAQSEEQGLAPLVCRAARERNAMDREVSDGTGSR